LYTSAPAATGAQAIIDAAALALTCDAPAGTTTCGDVVAPAFARGKAWAFATPGADATGATLRSVVVVVGASVPLAFGANESYSLEVNTTHAVVTASTQWGAMYGLESFFQLVLIEPWETCPVCNKYVIRADVPLSITDSPRVQWRGLMIDTGRHYLPPTLIKKTIDAMAASKLNALHWHLTDDQSFPLCLDAQPELCRLSQYHNVVTGAPQNYTPASIRDIVGYATARGVRVMPELDLPGHSVGLQRGAPSLYTNCSSAHKLPDPTNEAFFTLIDSIISELASLFPDAYLHMGGDEVDTSCWTENESVEKWMASRNLTAMGTLAYFQSKVQAIVQKHGKRAMFWDEFWAANLTALNSTVAEIRGTYSPTTIFIQRLNMLYCVLSCSTLFYSLV
jgi:hexosaminidase